MSARAEPASITEELLRAIEAAGPDRGLTGTRAGEVVRSLDPNFTPRDHGVATLRQFIQQHAQEVKIIGHQGLDPVYGLKDWEPLARGQAVAPTRQDPDFGRVDPWRVWTSPDSPFVLLIGEDDERSVRAVRRERSKEPGDKILLPLAGEAHRAMARAFLDSAEGSATALRAAVEDPSPQWWKAWLREMQVQPRSFVERWHEYRGKQLEAELRAALRHLSVGTDLEERAFACIAASRIRWRDGRRHQNGEQVARATGATLGALATEVLSRLNDQELRTLVGLVIGALSRDPGQRTK